MADESILNPHPAPEQPAPDSQQGLDAAGQSLANALRMSFRILTAVILILIVLFLCQGFFTVQADQQVIILRLGRTDASMVKTQGLHWSMPYPIDETVPVWIRPRAMEVNTFWSRVSEEAKKENVEKDRKEKPVVVPGAEDAFILSGDLNALQSRWEVRYRVKSDPVSIIKYYNEIGDMGNEERLMRALLQNAVVAEVGRMTVFDAYLDQKALLAERVKIRIEGMLQEIDAGLTLDEGGGLSLLEIRPPTDVKPSFDEVLGAAQTASTLKAAAEGHARKLLIDAAGPVGIELGEEINAWWTARSAGKTADMAKREANIRGLFAKAGGEVQVVLAEARTYRTAITQETRTDANQILSWENAGLLGTTDGQAKVKTFLDHARIEVLQDVLSHSYEKYVYNPQRPDAKSTLEIWLNRRSEIQREERKLEETR